MKIMKIALTLLFVLSASVIVQADTNTLNELERYAEKIVPEKFQKITADEDGLSSSMSFQKDDTMIQLTLSNDLESQMETEEN